MPGQAMSEEPCAAVRSREAPLAAASLHMGIMLLVPEKPSSLRGKNKHCWEGSSSGSTM